MRASGNRAGSPRRSPLSSPPGPEGFRRASLLPLLGPSPDNSISGAMSSQYFGNLPRLIPGQRQWREPAVALCVHVCPFFDQQFHNGDALRPDSQVQRHTAYVIFQMAELAVPRRLFRAILERIRRLRMPETVPR